MSLRNTLLQIYPHALNAVKGDLAVKKALINKKYQHNCHLIAIGKAAEAMSLGAVEQLGDSIQSGIILSKHDHFTSELTSDSRFRCVEADHPIPKSASLQAGAALIDYLQQLPAQSHCLFLISGGASSLVEVLQDGWTLDDLQAITQYLLSNAYSIDQINAVRRHISTIKAGGLWTYLINQQVTCLIISDVKGDDPAVIGSGLLFPSNAPLPQTLPQHWQDRLLASSPKTVHQAASFEWDVIATLDHAKQAAASAARELGYTVQIIPTFLEGDAELAAQHCAKQLRKAKTDITIWGGETTVSLPRNPPKGGRNQHFALASAIQLEGSDTALISLGTDGGDGTSDAAGGLVDGETVKRGTQCGLSAEAYLRQNNAFEFLKASGDIIVTGATGTNVMDIVIAIKKTSKN